jgi:hypothetical protein
MRAKPIRAHDFTSTKYPKQQRILSRASVSPTIVLVVRLEPLGGPITQIERVGPQDVHLADFAIGCDHDRQHRESASRERECGGS